MKTYKITDGEYASALAVGCEEHSADMRAHAARYVADRDALEITARSGAGFLIPRSWIGALRDVPVANLAQLELWPDGSAIEIVNRDVHISVHGLLAAMRPDMVSIKTLGAIFASRGGKVISDAKGGTGPVNG